MINNATVHKYRLRMTDNGNTYAKEDFYPETKEEIKWMFEYARCFPEWHIMRYPDHVIIAQSK